MPKRLLWVTAEPPGLTQGGAGIRQAHLLASLAREFEVHLVTTGHPDGDPLLGGLASITELPFASRHLPRSRTTRRVRDLWRSLFDPLSSGPIDDRGNRRVLGRHIGKAHGFDLVCVHGFGLAHLLPRHRTIPWTMTITHLHSDQAAQAIDVAPGRRQAWVIGRDRDKALRLERWVVENFDLTVVTCPEDAAALAGLGPGHLRLEVVPNGVDTGAFQPSPPIRSPRLVFTGSLDYLPNVDGLRWFCKEVWPTIKTRAPEATLQIVGRSPVGAVVDLARLDGVEVDVDVPRIAPYLEVARVVVVPLRLGSGTRLKVLEAMASGRPVVGTTIGLAGLGIVDGTHALVADDPMEMARQVIELLTNDGTVIKLTEAALALVADEFEWTEIGAKFAGVLGALER
ncbi:MAG: glycosyltransferase [Acidimicrobiales bacterium]